MVRIKKKKTRIDSRRRRRRNAGMKNESGGWRDVGVHFRNLRGTPCTCIFFDPFRF